LNSQVHDHEPLSSQLVWENLERVGDEETRPGERVEYTEQPDEGNLRISRRLHGCLVALLKFGCSDTPSQEHQAHSRGGCEEKWSSPDAVNEESTADTDNQTEQCLASVELSFVISHVSKMQRLKKAYWDLLVLLFNTHAVINKVHVIAEESVSRVL